LAGYLTTFNNVFFSAEHLEETNVERERESVQQSEKGKVFMGRKIQLVYEIGEQIL